MSLTRLLASDGYTVEAFASAREFLAREPHPGPCRARVMVKMRVGSVAELVRLADEAGVTVPKA